RLVGDVRLVEGRRPRSLETLEPPCVAWRRTRVVPLAVAGRRLDVRIPRGDVEEERLIAAGAAPNKGVGQPGEHVGLVGGRIDGSRRRPVVDDAAVLVQRVAVGGVVTI